MLSRSIKYNELHKCRVVKALNEVSLRESVRIRSFSGPYFSAFGLNTWRYSLCGNIRTRENPDTDTFHAVPTIVFTGVRQNNCFENFC